MKRNLCALGVSIALALSAAAACRADDVIQAGEMELYPTWSAVGIEIPYAGDDNGDAKAEFVWRRAGEAAWRNGVDMTIDRQKRFIWASVWPLEQGETVEVKVTLADPQAAGAATLEESVVTKRMILENSGGRIFYVSPEGGDENPGTKESPFKTLTHAASMVKAGDTVYAMSGVYHEGNLFAGLEGAPGRPIVFAAADGEHPVIDGSIEIKKGSGVWRQGRREPANTYVDPETSFVGYVAQDGLRMFPYGSMSEFSEDKLGVKRAWHYDPFEFYLFVSTGDDSAPDDHDYRVAVWEHAALLSGSKYVVIRGFEMRYFGVSAVRISGGAVGCIVTECNIHNAPAAVVMRGDKTTDNAVWKNLMYEPGLGDFPWGAIKASEYGRQGTRVKAGRGTSVCYNEIDGYFDAVEADSWLEVDRLDINRDFDMMYNRIRNTGDDAFEPDGGGVNIRMHGNTIRNCFAAISLAPVSRGPVYCTRNDATYYFLMFKLNVGGVHSLGAAYVYHNSGYCLIGGRGGGGTLISYPPGRGIPCANKVFRNNALIGKDTAVRSARPGEVLDYNCYWHVPGATPLSFGWDVKRDDGTWESARYATIEEFRAGTGQEEHGFYADPAFVSTPDLGKVDYWGRYSTSAMSAYPKADDFATGDLRLAPESPCVDAGTVIRGMNEDYKGKAPDMGAFEYLPAE